MGDRMCVKEECKNQYCKNAADCRYGSESDWEDVVKKQCKIQKW